MDCGRAYWPATFDGDGDIDLAAGNLGQNTILTAPMSLFVHDFDRDGTSDPLMVRGEDGLLWARRDAVMEHMPALFSSRPTYAAFSPDSRRPPGGPLCGSSIPRAPIVFGPSQKPRHIQHRAAPLRGTMGPDHGYGKP